MGENLRLCVWPVGTPSLEPRYYRTNRQTCLRAEFSAVLEQAPLRFQCATPSVPKELGKSFRGGWRATAAAVGLMQHSNALRSDSQTITYLALPAEEAEE